MRVTVLKLNGNLFETVGNAGFTPGNVIVHDLAFVVANETPYVAYSYNGSDLTTAAMKYNGNDWEYIGNPGFSPDPVFEEGYFNTVSLAVLEHQPYVAYIDSVERKATVMRFTGTEWVTAGPPHFSIEGINSLTQIALISYRGSLFVSVGNDYKVGVLGFNGEEWVPIGTWSDIASDAYNTAFYIYNSVLYLGYMSDTGTKELRVKKYE